MLLFPAASSQIPSSGICAAVASLRYRIEMVQVSEWTEGGVKCGALPSDCAPAECVLREGTGDCRGRPMCRSALDACYFWYFFLILSVLTGGCGTKCWGMRDKIGAKRHILCGIAKKMEENMQKFSVISEKNACKSNGFLI